jgi:diguanylate cyclase (GGDEF)-like protein/PAS domain S-box-containing protein
MFQVSIYTAIYLIASTVSVVAAFFAWRRRGTPGGTWIFLGLLAAVLWAVCDAVESSALTLGGHVLWSQIGDIGALTLPVFLLLFALEYTGRTKTAPWEIAALMVEPAIGVVVVFTNGAHHSFWTGFSASPVAPTLLVYHHGWMYWVLTACAYALLAITAAILIVFSIRNRDVYRYQSLTVLAAITIPSAAEIFYDLAPNVFPGVDPSITLAFSATLLTVAMLQFKFLDLIPVARDALIERLEDAVIVFDAEKRLIDANPQARDLLGLAERRWAGMHGRAALAKWPAAWELLSQSESDAEITMRAPEGRTLRLTTQRVLDSAGRCTGTIAVSRDVTEYVQAQSALHDVNARLHERIIEVESLHEELREQAVRDPLTGLFNRRYFAETIERELARARREGYPVSLVILDADNFKLINDTHGHATGDQVMRCVGLELRGHIRPGDMACRYGGDEFVMVLPNTPLEVAARRADELRQHIADSSIDWNRWGEPMTMSIGVAEFPTHGELSEQIMLAADQAVYQAKAAGRNCSAVAPVPREAQ